MLSDLDVRPVGGRYSEGMIMPELPEAETIANQLNVALAGRVLGGVTLVRPDVVRGGGETIVVDLPGRRVARVWRRAKRVIVELDPQSRLIIRLGMTGRIDLCRASDPIETHTHLRVAVRGRRTELRFHDPRRFGGVWWVAGGDEPFLAALGDLGPEPLDLTPAQFRELLERPRQIKAMLMDQRTIAGLGNIYCDEALHAAGIHPLTRACDIDMDHRGRLLRSIKNVLRRAIRHNGTTLMDYRSADGEAGSFQRYHRVYQREGKPCRECGTPIERLLAAGRSTFICPRCQPVSL